MTRYNDPQALELANSRVGSRLVKIRAADSDGHRSSANILIKRRYEWRGYQGASLPLDYNANRITLSATEHDETIGTITVGLDGGDGLSAEGAFRDEISTLRSRQLRICEFTKLAMDPMDGAKHVLASLFHVAFIVAHRIKKCDMLVLEVNPRHVNYYRRMLGCERLSEERLNLRVNAPAVLMCLDFSYVDKQISTLAGTAGTNGTERTLYPHFFTLGEETGIISRLHGCPWLTSTFQA
ncbi:MAG: long-chain N-acyl amino acid synthase [Burkholderiaceae bacterium]